MAMKVQRGKGLSLIGIVIGFAIQFAVAYFTRPKIKSNTTKPDLTPGTAHTRGATIPTLFGRRLLEPIILWVGAPEAIPQYETVRSKGSKKKKVLSGYKYKEAAIHALCLGPAGALHGIREAGELIYSTTITRAANPSGSSFTCTDGSIFRIYWGDSGNAIDTITSRYLSARSKFPMLCYVVWDKKEKQETRVWKELKYDVTGVSCEGTPLASASWIDTSTRTGVNPAAIAWTVLTGPPPYGRGLAAAEIDKTTLEAWAAAAVTEALPCNVLFAEGDTVGTALETLSREHGYMMPQNGSRLMFMPLRKPTTTPPTLDEDRIKGKPRAEKNAADIQPNRYIYTYSDIDERFNRNSLEFPSNGIAERQGGYVDSEDSLFTATDVDTASKLGSIRATYERQANNGLSFRGMRDLENLLPGQVIELPTGTLGRVSEITLNLATGETRVGCIGNLMTELVITTQPTTGGNATQKDVEADPRVMVLDVPQLNDGDPAIGVLRIRAHDQIDGAALYLSADSGPYVEIASDYPPVTGGDLLAGESIPTPPATWQASESVSGGARRLPSDPRSSLGLEFVAGGSGTTGVSEPTWPTTIGGTVVDNGITWTAQALTDGPVIRPVGPDYLTIANLTGDTTAWANEAQYAVFTNGLVVSLRNIEAMATTDRANSTPYSLGDERVPVGVSTGLVYVVTTAGTSDATEPDADLWRVDEGETVTDNTVTWTARNPRYRLKGIRWTGVSYTVSNLTGDTGVYIVPADGVIPQNDSRIVDGANVCIKTLPSANGEAIAIGSVSPVCITPTSIP